jgi:hypothetical protein
MTLLVVCPNICSFSKISKSTITVLQAFWAIAPKTDALIAKTPSLLRTGDRPHHSASTR